MVLGTSRYLQVVKVALGIALVVAGVAALRFSRWPESTSQAFGSDALGATNFVLRIFAFGALLVGLGVLLETVYPDAWRTGN
jgi:hypothetical protein